MRRAPGLLSAALLLACACQSEGQAKPAAAAEGGASLHRCTIEIAERGAVEPFEGRASGDDEDAVLEAAWADVCAKLDAADRDACRDESRFDVTISGSTSMIDGAAIYAKTIRLRAKTSTFKGEGASKATAAEACAAATVAACAAAGASGDCVAAGTHLKRGESVSSEVVSQRGGG
ncbi:MAG: hypothetical protein R3A79_03715 [Nannocystaceae bacterium]